VGCKGRWTWCATHFSAHGREANRLLRLATPRQFRICTQTPCASVHTLVAPHCVGGADTPRDLAFGSLGLEMVAANGRHGAKFAAVTQPTPHHAC